MVSGPVDAKGGTEPGAGSEFDMPRIQYWTNKHQSAEALRIIDKVPVTAKNANTVHLLRGLAFRSGRDPEGAVAEFDQVTNLDDLLAKAGLVAGSYSQVERYDKAIEILDRAIASNANADLYALRGEYKCAQGRFAEAIPDYKKAALKDSDRQRAYLCVGGELLRRQGKVKEALSLLDVGLKAPDRSSDGKYYLCRAMCYGQINDWPLAEQSCSIGLKIADNAIAKAARARHGSVEEIAKSQLLLERAKCYDHLGKKNLAALDREAHLKLSAATEDDLLGAAEKSR
ncbi:MAG: tetratricopeptide repeat protein [Cyanobacteria bacterium REEB67]|nr:tetratricopeptide repeat protein [Cyanobacteria bacterium REEB67]